MSLVVATCQFPVSDSVTSNHRYISQQMRYAAERGASVVHFPECALSGYVGVDRPSFAGFDWPQLVTHSFELLGLAKNLGVWVLLGSSHRLTGRRRPHNSVYVIRPDGTLADRYDKRFCAGDAKGKTGDLAHFTPGNHPCVVQIEGVKCAVLICHEYRYPELYREYKQLGVKVVFHSYHAANISEDRLAAMQSEVGDQYHRFNHGKTYPEITMPAAMQAYAASSHLWISCSNSSARESLWPAFFVRADGVVTGRLRKNRAGVLITRVDFDEPLYDSTVAWRNRAMNGIFHSGSITKDKRSRDRGNF